MLQRPVLCFLLRWAFAVGCVLALSACAVPERQKIGTPAEQISQELGQPHVLVGLPDGGQRWVYSRQPAGQQVYHLVFDREQRLVRVEQVLQAAHFYRLRQGHAQRQDVLHYFGQPALVEHVANFKGDIWTYRISENSIDRQAHVFIDPQGVVQRVMFTDEPRNDPGDRN